jgi:hypothetical protein
MSSICCFKIGSMQKKIDVRNCFMIQSFWMLIDTRRNKKIKEKSRSNEFDGFNLAKVFISI